MIEMIIAVLAVLTMVLLVLVIKALTSDTPTISDAVRKGSYQGAINGLSKILREGDLDPYYREALERARANIVKKARDEGYHVNPDGEP